MATIMMSMLDVPRPCDNKLERSSDESRISHLYKDVRASTHDTGIREKTSFKEVCTHIKTSSPAPTQAPFRLPYLPPEIRLQIYKAYFSSLSAFNINLSNYDSALHCFTNLISASSFFADDVPLKLFYQNATFCFDDGEAMKAFAGLEGMRENVRNVVIRYGVEREGIVKGRDWIFLFGECFEALESVEFVVYRGRGARFVEIEGENVGVVDEVGGLKEERCGTDDEYTCETCEVARLETWWSAIVDAMREGRLGGERSVELRLRCVSGRGQK